MKKLVTCKLVGAALQGGPTRAGGSRSRAPVGVQGQLLNPRH